MASVLLLGGWDRNDEQVAAQLAAIDGVELTLAHPPEVAPPRAYGAVVLDPTRPERWPELFAGQALVIHPEGAGRGRNIDSLEACLAARVPWLGLSIHAGTVRQVLAKDSEARARGVPAVVLGGLLPAVGALLARALVEVYPGTRELTYIYGAGGLVGEPAGISGVMDSLGQRMDVWEGGRRRSVSVLGDLRLHELPALGRHSTRSWPWADAWTLGESLNLDVVIPRIAVSPEAVGHLAALASRLPNLRRAIPPAAVDWVRAAAPGREAVLHLIARGEVRTVAQSVVMADRRLALARCIAVAAEAMLAWSAPLGVHTAERALSPSELLAAAAARGVAPQEPLDLPHVLDRRLARRYFILAP